MLASLVAVTAGGISAAGYITFLIIALAVAAIAGYLIIVSFILRKVSFTLGTVLIGVRAIANQTQPAKPVVDDIARDVAAIQQALEGLLPARRGRQLARRQPALRGRR